jgi:hypothetical protein
MKQLALSMFVFALVTGGFADGAGAQDQIIVDVPPASSTQAAQISRPAMTYDEHRRDELEQSSRRSRNALIGTAAATVVGAALLFPGLVNQCVVIDFQTTSELRCTSAGKALVGIGFPLYVGGLTGVLITGIMFGVRKGKLRRLEHRMAYDKSRAVRWDPASSSFVF